MKRYALVIICVIFLTSCTEASQSQSSTQSSPIQIFTSTDLSSLINGRPAVLIFWKATCAFCKHELPWFNALGTSNADVAVIAINMQEPTDIIGSYWQKGDYQIPVMQDPDAALRRKYRVSIQPTTIFIDANGEVVSRIDGPLSEEMLLKKVDELFSLENASSQDLQVPLKENRPTTHSPTSRVLQTWFPGTVKHLADFSLESILSGGPAKDGIPAINNPQFISLSQASFLQDDDWGIYVDINDDRRFYPYKILNWHEIVNDTVGGKHIFVTYCPLCATGVTYSRTLQNGTTTFGVSGLLAQSNLLMYDRATDSLWNQVSGQAVVGPRTGEKLDFIPSSILRVSDLRNLPSDTKVLSTETGHVRDYKRDPYAGYESSDETIFPVRATDDRLHSKELIYGITVGSTQKAYPDFLLRQKGIIQDELHGVIVRISFNKATGKIEASMPIIPSYWFAWVAQYPETTLYEQ